MTVSLACLEGGPCIYFLKCTLGSFPVGPVEKKKGLSLTMRCLLCINVCMFTLDFGSDD